MKPLLVIGVFLVFVGALFILISLVKPPFFAKLPGDIIVKKDGFSFYFPVTTCLVISLVTSFVFYLFSLLKR